MVQLEFSFAKDGFPWKKHVNYELQVPLYPIELWVTETDSFTSAGVEAAKWDPNQWVGYYIETVHGEVGLIAGNTECEIFLLKPLKYKLCLGDTFTICGIRKNGYSFPYEQTFPSSIN